MFDTWRFPVHDDLESARYGLTFGPRNTIGKAEKLPPLIKSMCLEWSGQRSKVVVVMTTDSVGTHPVPKQIFTLK